MLVEKKKKMYENVYGGYWSVYLEIKIIKRK
jgi:hypothetical protein